MDTMTQAPEQQKIEWVNMTEASEATGMHINTLVRFVKRHNVPTKKSMRDDRLRLVNLSRIKEILAEDE